MATDSQVTRKIIEAENEFGLHAHYRAHGGNFRTVYFDAPKHLPINDQVNLLTKVKEWLEANDVDGVKLTAYNNPPFFNRNTGRNEAGHPRHGHPLLEIESVWWIGHPCTVTYYVKGDDEMNNPLEFRCEAFSEDDADAKCLKANPGCTTTSVEWDETPKEEKDNAS